MIACKLLPCARPRSRAGVDRAPPFAHAVTRHVCFIYKKAVKLVGDDYLINARSCACVRVCVCKYLMARQSSSTRQEIWLCVNVNVAHVCMYDIITNIYIYLLTWRGPPRGE